MGAQALRPREIVVSTFKILNPRLKETQKMMTLMPPPPGTKVGFPLWRYLNQPLFKETTVLNPFHFWHRQRTKSLERCWEQNTVSFLERCWRQKYKSDAENQSTESS
jgi:hypothetical protein